ncbi:hypothetical protein ONZ43_g238 [Nemania bipapillata]|uniref:Uncharacterized protein n=1 Tax=Nemania bipapillata TaxID=110536 RepID=A0ACC2J8V4_9PEZI|nr:hypothetical protein ONZ43_g238 [Nemania bipapillata]
MSAPLYTLTAVQVRDLLNNNSLTVEDYARSLLDRIRERDGTIKAWAYLDTAFVLNQARALDQIPQDQRGPLHGLAIGIKDIMNTKVPLSLGAQTGGSIIRPASFTGVFAMKPTHEAISTEGQKMFAPTFDTFGFFARSVGDLQLLADVFALKDDEPPQEVPLDQVSVALVKTPMWESAGPGTVSAMNEAEKVLTSCGVHVEEVSFPPEVANVEELKRIQKVITVGEAEVAFLREYRVNKTGLAPEICDIVENVSNYTKREQVQASDTYANMRRIINNLADKYSVILTPSAIDEAPLGLGNMGSATFNTLWTGFHMPVINLPVFHGPNGMPVGVSLVASRYRDQHLLKVSQILGEALAQKACKERI